MILPERCTSCGRAYENQVLRNPAAGRCGVLQRTPAGISGHDLVIRFRRTISPETAEQLVKAKSRSIAAVGVFVNETPEHIAQVLKQVPLDVIQLHGSETAEIVSGVRWRTGLPVWKAVQVQTAADIQAARQLGADRLILEGKAGGMGITADWELIAGAKPAQPFLLAGGLTPENVAEAAARVQPDGVDFSSGIETGGVKDYAKMKRIVTIIRGV